MWHVQMFGQIVFLAQQVGEFRLAQRAGILEKCAQSLASSIFPRDKRLGTGTALAQQHYTARNDTRNERLLS